VTELPPTISSRLPVPLAVGQGDSYLLSEFGDADLPAIVALEQRASIWPWAERNFRDSVQSSHLCLGVKHRGHWCAHAVLSLVADEAELLILAVDPTMQRQGLGRALMTSAMDLVAGRAAELFLEVRQSNARAIAFYESLGFNCLGERRNYYPSKSGREHALVYGIHIGNIID
jgi:ribosomal-protein-alanine N-acetyltransferase